MEITQKIFTFNIYYTKIKTIEEGISCEYTMGWGNSRQY